MSFLHFYNFSRFRYLLALILILPLVACSAGEDGLSSNTNTNTDTDTSASTVKLSWVAPSAREDNSVLVLSDIAGFRIYYGVTPGDYSDTVDIDDHTATQAVLAGLPSGTYYVAVTTVDVDGRESTYSAEVVVTL